MKLKLTFPVFGLALLLSSAAAEAQKDTAQAVEAALKWRLAGLGLSEPMDTEGRTRETMEGYSDIHAGLLLNLTRNFHFNTRLQGFASSDEVFVNEDETPSSTDGFFAVRELWFGYAGIADLPGNAIRVGQQRIKAYDGLWWDQDVTAAHWLFDTTLVQARLAVAEQLFVTRTDRDEIEAPLRDRNYLLGEFGVQHTPGHFLGLRATYARDGGEIDTQAPPPPDSPEAEDFDPKREKVDLVWFGGSLDNDFFNYKGRTPLSYRLEVIGLNGEREGFVENPSQPQDPQDPIAPEQPTGQMSMHDVRAWAVDAGIRLQPLVDGPLRLGFAFAQGSGGGDAQESNRFQQTDLHSNRSRFTGTRAILERFNGALQPDLANLRASTMFLAWQYPAFDTSLVYHRFHRADRFEEIIARGVNEPTVTDSAEIGQGFDLIVSWYFDSLARMPVWNDETHANIRARLSRFDPGAAYGNAMDPVDRAALELTLYL